MAQASSPCGGTQEHTVGSVTAVCIRRITQFQISPTEATPFSGQTSPTQLSSEYNEGDCNNTAAGHIICVWCLDYTQHTTPHKGEQKAITSRNDRVKSMHTDTHT